jgi:hypothetical protein
VPAQERQCAEIRFEWRRQGLPGQPFFAVLGGNGHPRSGSTYWILSDPDPAGRLRGRAASLKLAGDLSIVAPDGLEANPRVASDARFLFGTPQIDGKLREAHATNLAGIDLNGSECGSPRNQEQCLACGGIHMPVPISTSATQWTKDKDEAKPSSTWLEDSTRLPRGISAVLIPLRLCALRTPDGLAPAIAHRTGKSGILPAISDLHAAVKHYLVGHNENPC